MRAVLFCGRSSGHFLRGVMSELRDRQCEVEVCDDEPFVDLDRLLTDVNLVLVENGISAEVRERVGQHRVRRGRYQLLFRAACHLSFAQLAGYDAIVADSDSIRDAYVQAGWSRAAWTWHEAADTSIFRPLPRKRCSGDVVWIGDWVDGHPVSRLFEYLLEPANDLGLSVTLVGAQYPEAVQAVLRERGVECAGPLANERVPEVLSAFRATVHIPERPNAATRIMEALACGVPLISAPWDDADCLFTPGQDYLLAHTGEEMRKQLRLVMEDARLSADLSLRGLQTILSRHTCAHRTDELIAIYDQLTAVGQLNYAIVH